MNAMELRVFEIERFAVHDGPGIRTVVFLKGCGLHCPWCSNPESQSAARQLLRDEKKCAACGACARACPNGAVSWTPGEMPRVDRARCRACGGAVFAPLAQKDGKTRAKPRLSII